jgi:hypothetical protein
MQSSWVIEPQMDGIHADGRDEEESGRKKAKRGRKKSPEIFFLSFAYSRAFLRLKISPSAAYLNEGQWIWTKLRTAISREARSRNRLGGLTKR